MLLSLIIPFFNSGNNSKRLFQTLAKIEQDDVEFILINDGSSDNTYRLLEEFKASAPDSNVTLINQNNQGPGGARNSGLKVAQGNYVWFVDCDDDIKLEAIEVIRENSDVNYDFVDFNVQSNKGIVNSMKIEAGKYIDEKQLCVMLLDNFGCIWSKVIKREFLLDNSIFYPEYCLYEDNPLRFIYPFFVKSFLKTEVVGYVHQLEFESVTRSKPNLRTFDRLYTALYGLETALKLAKSRAEIDALEKKFVEKYLIETVMKFFSKKPSKNWLITWRVMKQYRDLEKTFDIKSSPFDAMKAKPYSSKVQAYFIVQWVASYLILGDQTKHFDTIRKKAWNL